MRQDVKTESHDRVGCNNEGQQSQLMELLESEVARGARCREVVPCASCQHDYQIFYFLFYRIMLCHRLLFLFLYGLWNRFKRNVADDRVGQLTDWPKKFFFQPAFSEERSGVEVEGRNSIWLLTCSSALNILLSCSVL